MSINSHAYIVMSGKEYPVEQEVSHVDHREELQKAQQWNAVVSFVADVRLFTEMLNSTRQFIRLWGKVVRYNYRQSAQTRAFLRSRARKVKYFKPHCHMMRHHTRMK
jgi:hypothetical protein